MKNLLTKLLSTNAHNWAPVVLRLVLGFTMAAHGAQKLFGWFGGYGLQGTAGFFAKQLGMKPGIFNFEVGVPVSGTVQPVGRVKAGEIPGTTIVRTVYTGPYEGLGEAWGDFQEIIESQGHTLGPNLWERYLSGPESSEDSATFRTELNQTILVS